MKNQQEVNELIDLLDTIVELVDASDESDWTAYAPAEITQTLREEIQHLQASGDLGDVQNVAYLISAAGPVQEIAMANNWSDEFLLLAEGVEFFVNQAPVQPDNEAIPFWAFALFTLVIVDALSALWINFSPSRFSIQIGTVVAASWAAWYLLSPVRADHPKPPGFHVRIFLALIGAVLVWYPAAMVIPAGATFFGEETNKTTYLKKEDPGPRAICRTYLYGDMFILPVQYICYLRDARPLPDYGKYDLRGKESLLGFLILDVSISKGN
jgi:hypothetical protein